MRRSFALRIECGTRINQFKQKRNSNKKTKNFTWGISTDGSGAFASLGASLARSGEFSNGFFALFLYMIDT